MALDTDHNEVLATLTDIEFGEDSQTRATVGFESVPPEPVESEEDGEVPAEETESDEVEELEQKDPEDVETDGGTATVDQADFEPVQFENYRTWRFGLTQLLKFAGFRKSDLRETVEPEDEDQEPYTRTRPDASEMVLNELEGQRLVFKIQQEHDDEQYDGSVCSVVSPNYATLPSGELDQLVQNVIAEMGVSEEPNRYVRRDGFVVSIDYSWESEHEVEAEPDNHEMINETLGGGISIRNSVFGASSLRINKFYTILACRNGLRVRETEEEFKQIHMGSANELREAFEQELRNQIENIWRETDLIEGSHAIEFPLEEQIEWVENLAENGRITKRAAEAITEELEKGEESQWNLGRSSAWNLVNAFTGYTTHNEEMISDSARKQLERTYNDILYAEDRDELEALAQ